MSSRRSVLPPLLLLRNPVRDYAWGCPISIPRLLGRAGDGSPQAELWLGAHPSAPSLAWDGQQWTPLDRLISERPAEVLGEGLGGKTRSLPFLLKLLAASQALSIQAHPGAEAASAGWAREQAAGLPSTERNYRDDRAKPEILLALGRFVMLRGFREPAAIRRDLRSRGLGKLAGRPLRADRPRDLAAELRMLVEDWLRLPAGAPEILTAQAAAASRGSVFCCPTASAKDPMGARLPSRESAEADVDAWILRLAEQFPGDRGVLAPLYLRLEVLEAGEARFTGPGVLHAYLDGFGVELMGPSDNVLRGALTPKRVDRDELLRVLRFEPADDGAVTPIDDGGARRFEFPDGSIALSRLDPSGDRPVVCRRSGARIFLCVEGSGRATCADGVLEFGRGDSFLATGSAGAMEIQGSARLFRADAAP